MENTTKVSIIVPVYNKEKYIRECVDSLTSQTYRNIEIILIDDGSFDSSWDIIKSYSYQDGRIIALHQNNGGVCSARNNGIKHANGKWISFVDADDSLPINAIETMLAHAEENNVDLIIGNFTKIQGSNKFYIHEYDDDIIDHDMWKRIDAGRTWGQLYKSEIINRHDIRFIDGLAYSEDNVFLTNYSLYASSLEYISDSVYYYKINSDSVTFHPDRNKNAYHQFWAAFEVYKLRDIKKEHYAFIIKRTKNLIGAGINAYIIKSVDIVHLRTLIKLYRSFFNKAMSFDCSFFSQIFIRMVKLTLKFKWY